MKREYFRRGWVFLCLCRSIWKDNEMAQSIAILQNNASPPICQSVKYCVRNLCRASARLQISSLSFALCQIVLPALFYWIAISGSLQSSGETLRQKSFLSFYSIIGNFVKQKETSQRIFFSVMSLFRFHFMFYQSQANPMRGIRSRLRIPIRLFGQHLYSINRQPSVRSHLRRSW